MYMKVKGRTSLFGVTLGLNRQPLDLKDQYEIGWRYLMIKNATYIMKIQGAYYNSIGSTCSTLRWSSKFIKRNTAMSQNMRKVRDRFTHPLLPKILGVKKFNILKLNIQREN